jgi:hypothetical protein
VNKSVQEAFLNRVLRIFAISRNAVRNAEHLSGMTPAKLIEGACNAILRGRHEPLISHYRGIVGYGVTAASPIQ